MKGLAEADSVSPALASSIKNDAANSYKVGTTFDILWGVGVAAAVLLGAGAFAVSQGVVPGVQLPQL